MIRHHFELRETIATILCDRQGDVEAACRGLQSARGEVERCIARDPFFQATFEPYRPFCTGRTVERMSRAAGMAGVGPMAAVAGAIAWAGLEEMVAAGATFGVVDNGGDIAFVNDRAIRIGLHAGQSPLSDRYAFLIPPDRCIRGVCTSSATVGHSISFGTADAVTVFAPDVAIADAYATAICNEIRPHDQSVLASLDPAVVLGVFVVMGDETVSWGEVPQLVPARVDPSRITAGYLRGGTCFFDTSGMSE